MNAAELNKLKKAELIELSMKLQNEQSGLGELITTFQNNEARLRDQIARFRDEKIKLEELVANLTSEKQLLERKYGELFISDICQLTHSQSIQSGKAKQLLRANKSAVTEETLRIPKPPGQVDRNYNLRDAITGGGALEISNDTYGKLLVSTFENLMRFCYIDS